MNYSFHTIPSALAPYIQMIVVYDQDQRLSHLPLYTNGMAALLYQAGGPFQLYGQAVPDAIWNQEVKRATIAFFFKPFAASTLFNVAARDLKEAPLNLYHWKAPPAKRLLRQLGQAATSSEKLLLLNHFMSGLLKRHQNTCALIRAATDALLLQSDPTLLAPLWGSFHLTERTFQRLFKKHVGVTPTAYRRICQHYFAFSHLKGGHFQKLSDVALEHGYFDQSHFNRTFKAFTQVTPQAYLQSGLKGRP